MKLEEEIGKLLIANNLSLSTAESCTGGGVAALITSVPGSSGYFKGGIVAYDNEVKKNLLGVSPETLSAYGAVSRETVIEMAKGAMNRLKTDCAIATSGIAGPGGGTPEKPVGTVWIAAATPDGLRSHCFHFGTEREDNIRQSAEAALRMLEEMLQCE